MRRMLRESLNGRIDVIPVLYIFFLPLFGVIAIAVAIFGTGTIKRTIWGILGVAALAWAAQLNFG